MNEEYNKLPLKIILDVIADFMELDEEHCYIYNQKWSIPKDGKICVVGSMNTSKIIANNKKHTKYNNVFTENLNLRQIQTMELNIFGYDLDVLTRKDEVIMALKTDKAQNTFEDNGFSIADIPNSILNANESDGAKILYRYIMSFSVFCGKNRTINSDSFVSDKFEIKAKDN
jgi:hypothetical protein